MCHAKTCFLLNCTCENSPWKPIKLISVVGEPCDFSKNNVSELTLKNLADFKLYWTGPSVACWLKSNSCVGDMPSTLVKSICGALTKLMEWDEQELDSRLGEAKVTKKLHFHFGRPRGWIRRWPKNFHWFDFNCSCESGRLWVKPPSSSFSSIALRPYGTVIIIWSSASDTSVSVPSTG